MVIGHLIQLRAEKYVKNSKDAGLKEINFSTGDQHQSMCSDKVLLGSLMAIEQRYTSFYIVRNAQVLQKFRENDLKSNPIFKKLWIQKIKILFTYICSFLDIYKKHR